MPSITFEYVQDFDFANAIYDSGKEFVVRSMRRSRNGINGSIKNSMIGAQTYCASSAYERGYPVQHMPTGELLVMENIREPDNRGRYTTGGYDFTVVASGDPLFRAMVEHISLPDTFTKENAPPTWPKMCVATFHKGKAGDSDTQHLIIDHIHDRVYSMGLNAEEKRFVPDKFKHDPWRIYTTSPKDEWLSRGVIRMTLPRSAKNVPKGYKDLHEQCAMWFRFQGSDIMRIYNEQYKANVSMYHSALKAVIEPEQAVRLGFEGLDNVSKALVAKNGEVKNLPRLRHDVPWLKFNSRAFFTANNIEQ